MSLHLKLLDIDHPLTFEKIKLRQIEAHALIYLSWSVYLISLDLPVPPQDLSLQFFLSKKRWKN